MIMTSGGMYGGPSLEEQLTAAAAAVSGRQLVPMARIDDAVRRVLRVKHALGLISLEPPPEDAAEAAREGRGAAAPDDSCVGCEAHRTLARQAVSQSAVLLLNRDGILPLASSRTLAQAAEAPSLYVTGRGADHLGMQCGGWSLEWQGIPERGQRFTTGTTLWEAVHAACERAVLVPCEASAADAAQRIRQHQVEAELLRQLRASSQPAADGPQQSRAADSAPIAIVVAGEPPYAEGGGDTRDLALGMWDVELIDSLAADGVRVVLLLLSGRPLVLPPSTLEKLAALVACWLPGTEGDGIADVLFGLRPFSGALGFSWPASNAQAVLAVRRKEAPLFARGHGLRTVVLGTV